MLSLETKNIYIYTLGPDSFSAFALDWVLCLDFKYLIFLPTWLVWKQDPCFSLDQYEVEESLYKLEYLNLNYLVM